MERLVAVVVFVFTAALGPYYLLGDQVHYRRAYDYVATVSLSDGFEGYSQLLSAREVVHYVVIWIGARFAGKDWLMAAANAVLAVASVRLLRNWGGRLLVVLPNVLFGYYFLVLYLPAERLKFGVLFLAWSMCSSKRFHVLAPLAGLSHVQVLLQYASALAWRFSAKTTGGLRSRRRVALIVGVGAVCVVLSFLAEHMIAKFSGYSAFSGRDVSKVLVFLVLSVVCYSSRPLSVVAAFLPLLVAAYLVGDERINMFSYFTFLFFGLKRNSGLNAPVVAMTLYFLYRGGVFVADIVATGTGF